MHLLPFSVFFSSLYILICTFCPVVLTISVKNLLMCLTVTKVSKCYNSIQVVTLKSQTSPDLRCVLDELEESIQNALDEKQCKMGNIALFKDVVISYSI